MSPSKIPSKKKVSKILPVFIYNHRPISILPQLSKILENLFAKGLNSFPIKYGLSSNVQYSFKSNTSIYIPRFSR